MGECLYLWTAMDNQSEQATDEVGYRLTEFNKFGPRKR